VDPASESTYGLFTRRPLWNLAARGFGYWTAKDVGDRIMVAQCPTLFKKYTGLKKHLKPCECVRMEWTPPLRDQDG
jgi:hypothetical protein